MQKIPQMALYFILPLSLQWGYAQAVTIEEMPFRLLFWHPSDIRDASNVRFRVVPFSKERRSFLIVADPTRPSLWYSPTDAVQTGEDVRIYYQRIEKDQKEYVDQRTWCLGTLKPDGTFECPDLNRFPDSAIKPANAVLQRSMHKPTWGGFNVFQIANGKDSLFRLLYWDQPAQGEAGGMIAESTDGIHWRKDLNTAAFTEHNDAYSLVYDGSRDEYLLYQTRLLEWKDKPILDNLPEMKRVISLRTSHNLISWTPQKDVILPDSQDAPTCEFYLLKAFQYSGRYLGFLMKYYADPSNQNKHSGIYRYELVMSPDGIAWARPYRAEDIGVWTYASPFLHAGDLCVVAYDKGGLALFRTRLDGFVACGTEGRGSFMTQPFRFPKSGLVLNADTSAGEISVQILDPKGLPLERISPVSLLANVDGTAIPLDWGGKDVSPLGGKEIMLKIQLNHAWIYSLRGR